MVGETSNSPGVLGRKQYSAGTRVSYHRHLFPFKSAVVGAHLLGGVARQHSLPENLPSFYQSDSGRRDTRERYGCGSNVRAGGATSFTIDPVALSAL